MKKRLSFLLMLLCGTFSQLFANNVQISNAQIVNNGPGNIQVEFGLSWENSWRTNIGPNNYDGVWVFFKYKTPSGNWTHLTLTGNNNDIPEGFTVYQTNDFQKAGAMIFRSSTNMGFGSVSILEEKIKLGVISTLPYDIDVRGFAIEMVFVPGPTTRPFFGDGNGTVESGNAFHYTNNTATTGSVVPMTVDVNSFDDNELEGVTNSTGIYVYSNDTIQKTQPLGSLDPFPTMKALWCMKYELSQAQYRDFLNTLTYTQQAARTVVAPSSAAGTHALGSSDRSYIEIATPGSASGATMPAVYGCDANNNNTYDEDGDGEWVACGYISWPDLAAYLDWSGLAPMSELQYERICRGSSSAGPNAAIYGQFAWGDSVIVGSAYTVSDYSQATEYISTQVIGNNALLVSPSGGNAVYASTHSSGPLRCGIFATESSNRKTSGAGFYGTMEMSGNLTEYCITLGNAAGRSVRFIPNGNGNISAAGNAQLSVGGAGFWPGMEGNLTTTAVNTCSGTCEVTGAAGMMLRGGSYVDPATELRISERGSSFTPTARSSERGGRGVLYLR
jgi:formylglycine-generating enzyme required for sulfatase activity